MVQIVVLQCISCFRLSLYFLSEVSGAFVDDALDVEFDQRLDILSAIVEKPDSNNDGWVGSEFQLRGYQRLRLVHIGPTPCPSNFEEDNEKAEGLLPRVDPRASALPGYPVMFSPTLVQKGAKGNVNMKRANGHAPAQKAEDGGRDLHVFVWSSSASPVFGGHDYEATDNKKEVRLVISPGKA